MIFDDPMVQIVRRINTIEKQIRELFLRLSGSGSAFTSSRDVMGGHGAGGSIVAGGTAYIVPMIAGLDTAGRSFPWPIGGTLKNLYVRLATSQPVTGSLVATIWDVSGPTNTGITITIPAGSGGGTYSDTTHTYAFTGGNLIQLQLINNASSASAVIGGCAWEIDYGLI